MIASMVLGVVVVQLSSPRIPQVRINITLVNLSISVVFVAFRYLISSISTDELSSDIRATSTYWTTHHRTLHAAYLCYYVYQCAHVLIPPLR